MSNGQRCIEGESAVDRIYINYKKGTSDVGLHTVVIWASSYPPMTQLHHGKFWTNSGPDLRGTGSGPQASHQQRASHQTLHILFVANNRCLRDYDLIVVHC